VFLRGIVGTPDPCPRKSEGRELDHELVPIPRWLPLHPENHIRVETEQVAGLAGIDL
jgi:hypothetical protein